MIITTGTNFIGYNTVAWLWGCNGPVSDPNYGSFGDMVTTGNLDIFIAKPVDLTRQPYDYYMRSGTGCNKSFVGVCITDKLHTFDSCPDTMRYCSSDQLWVNSNTCSPWGPEAGPFYTYLWSNSQTTTATNVTSTGVVFGNSNFC